jgi:hypothetical protein
VGRRVSLLVALLLPSVALLTNGVPAAAAPVPGTTCQVLPSDNIWNTDISQLPVHARSAQWLASMAAGTTKLHPDFGGPPYGFPFNVVDNSHQTVSVSFQYAGESDPGPYPVGNDTSIEQGSDRHAMIINKNTCTLYELFALSGSGTSWTAGSGAIFPLNSDVLRPSGWTSADAAGLPIFPGLVRWDEVQAGAINHAIRFTAVQTDQSFLWPARHQAGAAANPSLPPMGARFRLKAGYNITGFSAQAQVILRAMQHYGLILADNGSNWFFSGTEDANWPDSLLSELKTIPASQFEAIDESSLMVDPNSATTASGCGNATLTGGPGPSSPTPFYFAEGFTGTGFAECLSLFTPNVSGTAQVDYYLNGGGQVTQYVSLQAGRVTTVNVNAAVGAGQEVSARVLLPGPGVVERSLHFLFGAWHGSTDVVGVAAPATEWDFAEGSTLPFFSEYLTLQNPNAAPVTATLNYFTDTGAHPVKTVPLPANSRTTVQVFDPTLGVGPGFGGVSVKITAPSPIVAERPMYVNGFSFGSGAIRDGHDAFGANAPATQWNFAEGTTLAGFYEYLTLQNPNVVAANVSLRYLDDSGTVTTRSLSVAPQSRFTVPVFQTADGVGPGVGGVSIQVTADQPIVAERPIYMVHDFGTGAVAGAHVVVGATSLGKVFGFAAASTMTGDEDYLTIQNPNGVVANMTVTYYTVSGTVVRSLTVGANTRRTVVINDGSAGSGGLGAGSINVGVVLSSDQPVLVEKPTYSSNLLTYGATDTLGSAGPF